MSLTAYTVRIAVRQRTGLDVEFDETYITDHSEQALLMAEHYRTTPPAPLSFQRWIVHEEPYVFGAISEWKRKNWCIVHLMPLPTHAFSGCQGEQL
jgi:hypothetical protein